MLNLTPSGIKLTPTGVKINTNLVWTSHNTGGVEFNTGVFAVCRRRLSTADHGATVVVRLSTADYGATVAVRLSTADGTTHEVAVEATSSVASIVEVVILFTNDGATDEIVIYC